MTVRDSFNQAAPEYDRLRRRLIPCFDAFYATAVEVLEDRPPRTVLDLGAGTGLLAAAVRARFPAARLILMDVAEDMLALASRRFAGDGEGTVEARVADYAKSDLGGPYDAIVSALSIHHLEHEDKQALFRRIVGALAPGGRFINADMAAGPTPALDRGYTETWVTQVRALGVTEDELADARQRQTYDRLAPLADQLRWMEEAGLDEVDCVFKSWSFVVLTGVRPPA